MLRKRSKEKELMDLGPAFYSQEEYEDCLSLLFELNLLFGYFQDTINLLKELPQCQSLCDIGCGDGYFLIRLSKYFPTMNFIGMDISAGAIKLAQQRLKNPGAVNLEFKQQLETNSELPPGSTDIVLLNLVCHHLDDNDLIALLKNAYKAANKAIIINDLHRHILAWWYYWWLSPLLFRNRLITHDGLVSIKRGFKKRELQALLAKAGISQYKLTWRFPFRWRILIRIN